MRTLSHDFQTASRELNCPCDDEARISSRLHRARIVHPGPFEDIQDMQYALHMTSSAMMSRVLLHNTITP